MRTVGTEGSPRELFDTFGVPDGAQGGPRREIISSGSHPDEIISWMGTPFWGGLSFLALKMPQVRAKCDQNAPSGVQKYYFRAWERTENITKSPTRDLGSKRFSYELLVLIVVRRFGHLFEKNNPPRFQV